ncbi:hypothetical protein ACT2FY_08570 [Paraburkholderia fungorum]|uniref:hypothetical protein n=1 Tax=Paraburkholderia fungorum TaxID=134537 RepID=UPI00402B8B58
MKKKLTIALAALGFATAAVQSNAATPAQILDIAWLKDGQQIEVAHHVIYSEAFGARPFAYSSGTSTAYGTCADDGRTKTKRSESLFVGRALLVKPIAIEASKAQLTVSAHDTTLEGMHLTGNPDCRTEVPDVRGLSEDDIHVDIPLGQTVDAPLKDSRYRLALTLRVMSP